MQVVNAAYCSHIRSVSARRLRAAMLWLGGAGLLFNACSPARAQQSLSQPISGSVSQPIYSESTQNGPSSTLFDGDNNLVNPYLRTGISDPLSFLIESSFMSPYPLGGGLVNSYADAYFYSQVINDSTIGERFSQYQDNRALMSGAGSLSLPRGRTSGAGGALSASAGARTAGNASYAFGGISMRAPFAAGSSVLATRQSDSGAGGFIDPNAILAATTSSAALSGTEGDVTLLSTAAAMGAQSGASGEPGTTGAPGALSMVMLSDIPLSVLVRPPTSEPIGPEAGSIFPDVSLVGPSATGFQDATMGTAGLPHDLEDTGASPLMSEHAESTEGPFPAMSGQGTRFLSPTLLVGDPGSAQGPIVSLSELARKARMHAMIYNPGAPLPTAFEERALERQYKKKLSGRHSSRYDSMTSTAPSIKP